MMAATLEKKSDRRSCVAASWARDSLKEEALVTATEIEAVNARLAAEIDATYAGTDDVVLVGLLDGAFVFLADLARKLTIEHRVDFMVCSSYGSGTESSGSVTITRDARDVSGKHVVIVDDICDSGLTLQLVLELMRDRGAASVRACVLLNKASRRQVQDLVVDFTGLDIPDEFVVGYGMDFDSHFRSLPFVGVLRT